MTSPTSYEDDYIKFTITNYDNGTWTIINKKPCTYNYYRNNTVTTTQLAANTTTSCVYTENAIREFDFN